MDQAELFKTMHEVANDILLWIGFGTLAGLLAKAIMPGRDPGGAVATLLMGIGGSVIGSGVLTYFWEGHRVTPISPEGFAVATAGAFVLLAFYRFFRRDQYIEGDSPRRPYFAGGKRGRGKREVIIEE
ncbi:MAG TPA: GlsB/YeaQ/YmgE family stress response membrane protein [Pirellulales bacterium]